MEQEIFTIQELAKRWNMSVARLRYWKANNIGPIAFQIGGKRSKLQYHIDDIRAHEAKRRDEEAKKRAAEEKTDGAEPGAS